MLILKVGLKIWREEVRCPTIPTLGMLLLEGKQRWKWTKEITEPEIMPHLSLCLFSEGYHANI